MNPQDLNNVKRIYQIGALVWSNYWGKYDKVLSLDFAPDSKIPYSMWSVTVIECDEQGSNTVDAIERVHYTLPDVEPHRPHIFQTPE